MEPQPTPYDIVGIPFFPFEPGLTLWLALLLGVVLVFVSARLLSARYFSTPKRNASSLLEVTLREIEQILQSKQSEEEKLSRLSLFIRRFLSFQLDTDLASKSPSELRTVLRDVKDERLRELLEHTVTIDTLRYQKNTRDGTMKLVESVRSSLRAFAEARS